MRSKLLPFLACCVLAGAVPAADATPASVEIAVPLLGIDAEAQPPGDDALGFTVHCAGAGDAFLASEADTSLWKEAATGNADGKHLVLRDNRWSQALVRVDTAGLAASIEAAAFRCRIGGAERPGKPGTISLHRMLVPWSESATWDRPDPARPDRWQGLRPGTDYEAEPFAQIALPTVGKAAATVTIPGCAAAVEAWRTGRWPNHGLLVLYGGAGVQVWMSAREQSLAQAAIHLGDGASAVARLDRPLLQHLLPRAELLLRAELVLQPAGTAPLAGSGLQAAGAGPFTVVADGGSAVADVTSAVRAALAADPPGIRITAGTASRIAGPADRAHAPALRVTLLSGPKTDLFPVVQRIRPGVFTSVRDGHLWYGDNRLRLWGTLGSGSLDRVQRMGFNAFRWWCRPEKWYRPESGLRGELAPYQPGDGSPLDLADKDFAYLRGHDIFVMSTALTMVTLPGAIAPGSFLDDGGDWPAWLAAVQQLDKDKTLGKAVDIAQLFDPRLQRMRITAARNFLEHRNPYTGRRYADEEGIAIHEIANEDRVVARLLDGGADVLGPYFGGELRARWNAWLAARYRDDAALAAAWGEVPADGPLAGGGIALGPTGGDRARHRARADDYARFVLELHRGWQNAYRDACRAVAQPGTGVAVVPFSFDTQYRPDLTWTWDNAWGDVQNFGMYFWDTTSLLARPPSLYVEDSTTVAGKPTVIYETNHGRPGAFRGEYPFMLAAFAAWQDWDAVFFHYWGGPPSGAPDETWLVTPMMPPTVSHFWTAVHTSADPVMCAAIATAGRAFLSGAISPAPSPSVLHVGREALLRNGAAMIGATAFARGARLAFDPEGAYATRWEGAEALAPTTDVQAGGQITWAWTKGRLIVDTPTVKILAGRTAAHRFADGITVSGFDLPSTSFALVSADGLPLADGCTRAWVCAVADGQNTGFRLDTTKPLDGPINQAKAVIDAGRAPVVVQCAGWTLSFPSRVRATYTPYDFALRPLPATPVADGTLRQHGGGQWLGVLAIAARGAAVEPVVDAVTAAPPAAADDDAGSATDPALASIPHPLTGVSWGDNPRLAMQTLRDRQIGSDIRSEDGVGAGQRVVRITGVRDPGGVIGVADVRLLYHGREMRAVELDFTAAPAFADAVAIHQLRFGKPIEQHVADQAHGSLARWRTADGLELVLQDVQGVVSERWSR